MRIKSKLIAVVMAVLLLGQLTACSLNKKITTDKGTELSIPLSSTISFLDRVRVVYITIGTVAGANYDLGYMTPQEFNKLTEAATTFQLDLTRSKKVMLGWYDAEEAGVAVPIKELQESARILILKHLHRLANEVKKTSISSEDKQVIDAALSMLNTLYAIGENK